jgi:hypothetical protein
MTIDERRELIKRTLMAYEHSEGLGAASMPGTRGDRGRKPLRNGR